MPMIFSYGTLQDEEVQLKTFGRTLNGEKDLLHGYEPSLVPIADATVAARLRRTHHDNITSTGDEWSSVQGTALEVSDDELTKADAFEAEYNYRRVEVVLSSGKSAWVYVHGDI